MLQFFEGVLNLSINPGCLQNSFAQVNSDNTVKGPVSRSGGSNYLNYHPTLTAAGSKFAQAVGKLGKAGKGGECWWEHKMHLDKEKVLACLAETIKTWNRVLMDEEGLKCVFAAQDNTEQLLACKAKHNGAKVNEVKANEVKASEVKANGAGAVTVNFFLGVSLAALLLVRAG